MKRYIRLPFLLIIAFRIHAQNLGITSDCATNPPNFGELSYEDANKAVKSEENTILETKMREICPEYISNLVHQLRHEKLNDDNKTLAIYFLGSLHPSDTNSIEFLIKNIDFRASKFDPPLGPMRWGTYPAEEALLKIGEPAVNPILNHLPSENNELRRQLMCDVLKQVLRRQ